MVLTKTTERNQERETRVLDIIGGKQPKDKTQRGPSINSKNLSITGLKITRTTFSLIFQLYEKIYIFVVLCISYNLFFLRDNFNVIFKSFFLTIVVFCSYKTVRVHGTVLLQTDFISQVSQNYFSYYLQLQANSFPFQVTPAIGNTRPSAHQTPPPLFWPNTCTTCSLSLRILQIIKNTFGPGSLQILLPAPTPKDFTNLPESFECESIYVSCWDN